MKRFYKDVSVAADEGGFVVQLDGRTVKTQGRALPQRVPSAALAEALAAEWAAQGEKLDPAAFMLRDMADYAIDMVAADPGAVIDKLLAYGETDTLCYRAEPGEALLRRQEAEWEPLLARVEAREEVRFERISGILHRPQPSETLARLRRTLETRDPFTLAGLETLASIAASLCIALEALEEGADIKALFACAELEELWQAELWGSDSEAEARHAKRGADFAHAARFIELARS